MVLRLREEYIQRLKDGGDAFAAGVEAEALSSEIAQLKEQVCVVGLWGVTCLAAAPHVC